MEAKPCREWQYGVFYKRFHSDASRMEAKDGSRLQSRRRPFVSIQTLHGWKQSCKRGSRRNKLGSFHSDASRMEAKYHEHVGRSNGRFNQFPFRRFTDGSKASQWKIRWDDALLKFPFRRFTDGSKVWKVGCILGWQSGFHSDASRMEAKLLLIF